MAEVADVLDLAAELIDEHGWWRNPGVVIGSSRPLTALTAITRAAYQVLGEVPELFDHISEAIDVLEASLKLEKSPLEDQLIEWNNTRDSADAVTDALRFASLELRFAA